MDVVPLLPTRWRNGWAILLLWIGLIFAGTLVAGEADPDLLTPAERAWLAAHPEIRLGSDQSWVPYVKVQDDGTVAGIEADLLARINALTGANIRLVLGPWADIVAQAERGELDGLAVSAAHPERAAQFLFSASPYSSSRFIYTRGGKASPFRAMADLAGKKVAVLRGNLAEQKLLARTPGLITVEKASNPELAFALASGEVDAAISSITLLQIIRQELLSDLGIAFVVPDSQIKLLYSIRREHPELLSIIDKALAAISPGEIQAILDKWGATLVVPSAALSLTEAERAWLTAHPVIRTRIFDLPPINYWDSGPRGIAVDTVEAILGKLGVRLDYQHGPGWLQTLDDIRTRQGVDLLLNAQRTPQRETFLVFSQDYLNQPWVIFTRTDQYGIFSLEDLFDKTIAIEQGYVLQEQLAQDYPLIRQRLFMDTAAAVSAVSHQQADAYIGNLTVVQHYIAQRGLSNLKVAAGTALGSHTQAFAARDDWPLLIAIIDKGLAALNAEERNAIQRKYFNVELIERIDYTRLWQIVVLAALILLIVMYWNRRLAHEIQQRRQAEAALTSAKEQAEAANRAKSAFLANVSHELRTPLNAVLGFSSLLRGKELAEKDQGYLEAIRVAGKGLSQLIDDILDLSRIEADKIELRTQPVELRVLLRDLELMFSHSAEAKGLVLQWVVEEGVPPVLLIDAVRLRQILVNLIGNAVKFTEAGQVQVRAVGREEGRTCHLHIAVTDTGPGIPLEQQEEIFNLFTQRRGQDPARYGGAGLGLSICRRLAGLMGGEIRLTSTVGQGSTFTLILPALAIAHQDPVAEDPTPLVENIAGAPAIQPADLTTDYASVRLPPALDERLQTLNPPFASINELEAFGRLLMLEGEQQESPTLRTLGQRLLRQAEAFDMNGLRQQIEALKAARLTPSG